MKTVEDIEKEVGLRWKAARILSGMSLEDVKNKLKERQLDFPTGAIECIEKGAGPSGFQTFIMLACDIYNTTPNKIFGKEGLDA